MFEVEMATCVVDGCDFEGSSSSVEAHISGKRDELHKGKVGRNYREEIEVGSVGDVVDEADDSPSADGGPPSEDRDTEEGSPVGSSQEGEESDSQADSVEDSTGGGAALLGAVPLVAGGGASLTDEIDPVVILAVVAGLVLVYALVASPSDEGGSEPSAEDQGDATGETATSEVAGLV